MLGIYEPTALDVPILSGSHGSLAVHLRKITRTVFNRYPTTKDVVLHDHGPGAHLNYLSDILTKSPVLGCTLSPGSKPSGRAFNGDPID